MPAFPPFRLNAQQWKIRSSSVEHLMAQSHGDLYFLLAVDVQRRLITKVAGALRPGGRFLFTAPSQSCSWSDAMTGRTSVSLGQEEYAKELAAQGMSLLGTADDEGENHYYSAQKR
jgi:hypothetical protein